jgi:hypothetical protein
MTARAIVTVNRLERRSASTTPRTGSPTALSPRWLPIHFVSGYSTPAADPEPYLFYAVRLFFAAADASGVS